MEKFVGVPSSSANQVTQFSSTKVTNAVCFNSLKMFKSVKGLRTFATISEIRMCANRHFSMEVLERVKKPCRLLVQVNAAMCLCDGLLAGT